MDVYATTRLAADIAIFEVQTALPDINTVPKAAAGLAQRQIGDAAGGCFKKHRVFVRCFDRDAFAIAVPDDLDNFVDNDALAVKSWPHGDPVARLGRREGVADSEKIPAERVDDMRGRFGLVCRAAFCRRLADVGCNGFFFCPGRRRRS